MNKILSSLAAMAMLVAAPAYANGDNSNAEAQTQESKTVNEQHESEFASDERLDEGFITSYINKAIASGMEKVADSDKPELGRKLTSYASAPKFGGYFVGKYDYNDKTGQSTNGGFSQRLVRFYVDGTILGDFAYRIQVQTNNASFHMKDYFLEWRKYDEFKVKVGQYKRAFGFENPMNPWDVGTGDYSQVTKKLTGHSDYIGAEASSTGGRDQGLQIQGDLFPVGKDKHRLIHYQLMVANGQGVNTADANKHKDLIGTIQVQPVKGLFVGAFGWTGDFTQNGVTVNRNRYMISAKYDKNDWSFRAEYAHNTGDTFRRYDATSKSFSGTHRSDGWYATVGVPVTSWLKVYAKYDVYRDQADWASAQTIYSLAPNFQIHKNLMLQVQYNRVHDRNLAKDHRGHNEIWAETYVRF